MLDDGKPPRAGLLINLAWTSVLDAIRKMPALFGSAAVLTLIIGFGDAIFTSPVWTAASVALEAIALAPVAVAVHRLVLLEETTAGTVSWKEIRVWRFVGWTIVFAIVSELVSAVPHGNSIGIWTTGIVLLVCVSVVSVRCLLIFPAVAIEETALSWNDRLTTSWILTRGHFWQLALALIGALMMLIVPIILFLVLIQFLFGYDNPGLANGLEMASDVLFGGLQPVCVGLGAAIASWFYMWVRQYPVASLKPAEN